MANVNKGKRNNGKKQAPDGLRAMAKIDPAIHARLKKYADEKGLKFGIFLDDLLRSGMVAKGIPSNQETGS
jgi:hypothetical protein